MPVDALVFFIRPNSRAKGNYENHAISFRYKLIKLWELPARNFVTGEAALLPFIPLMRNGERYIEKARKRIENAKEFSGEEKRSLLTILYMYTAIKDPDQAEALLEETRHVMFESPLYDLI